MASIVLIPARSGSRGIPDKNIKTFLRRPLMAYVIMAGVFSRADEVYAAVDNEEYADIAKEFGASVYMRPAWTSLDDASTESLAVTFCNDTDLRDDDTLIILQPTSPYTTATDINNVLEMMKEGYDSILSVYRKHVFTWEKKLYHADGIQAAVTPTYSPAMRPLRQEWEGQLFENGAIYATTVGGLRATYSRLSGCIGLYEQSLGFELDDPMDWEIGETLMGESWITQQ